MTDQDWAHEFIPPASPEPTPGLRDLLVECLGDDETPLEAFLDVWLPRFAALAASPAPEPTGLDAERLAAGSGQ